MIQMYYSSIDSPIVHKYLLNREHLQLKTYLINQSINIKTIVQDTNNKITTTSVTGVNKI